MKNTDSTACLRHHFLISMPHMEDENFSNTLTYVCDHTDQGAMGIVINRPTEVSLKEMIEQLNLDSASMTHPDWQVYSGGPVQVERGFVLHTSDDKEWLSSFDINDELSLTTSMDILEAIARGEGPGDYLVALGYAGWGAGQLEEELSRNTWLSCPADLEVLFHTEPGQRMTSAANILGIDLRLLTSEAGHS